MEKDIITYLKKWTIQKALKTHVVNVLYEIV